jgi:DnaJ-class molecular chaperone
MDKKFNPEKYTMMVCPVCEGSGRISYPDDVQVCQNCGGFGFIKKEEKTFDQTAIEFQQPLQAGSRVVKE